MQERRLRGDAIGEHFFARVYWGAVWVRYVVVRWLQTLPIVPCVRPMVHRDVVVLVWSLPRRRIWWLRSAVATRIGSGRGSLASLKPFLDDEAERMGVREFRLTAFHPKLVRLYEQIGYSARSRGRRNGTRMYRALRHAAAEDRPGERLGVLDLEPRRQGSARA